MFSYSNNTTSFFSVLMAALIFSLSQGLDRFSLLSPASTSGFGIFLFSFSTP